VASVAPLPPQPPPQRQGYANHVHRPVAASVAGFFALFGFVASLALGFNDASWLLVLSLVSLSVSVMTLVVISRTYIVRLQNRIIRVEMLLRLERLGLGADFGRLSMPQVAALRFASDAELPALIGRAINERLTSDQIKRAVTDWQGDYFRT
jgi:hypothetical protein